MDRLRVARLTDLEHVSDTDMELELRRSQLDPTAPCPSVESMIHAAVPDTAVLHTHADAVLAISNTHNGDERMRELFGELAVVVPYARSGFAIGSSAVRALRSHRSDDTIGLIVMDHGVFAFGYDRVRPMTVCSSWSRWPRSTSLDLGRVIVDLSAYPSCTFDRAPRRAQSDIQGLRRPCIVSRHMDEETWSLTSDADIRKIASRGPVTPDTSSGRSTSLCSAAMWMGTPIGIGPTSQRIAIAHRGHACSTGSTVVIDDALGLLGAGPDVG